MACLPLNPQSEYIYDSGWVAATTSIHTSALTQGQAPYAEVFTLPSVITQTDQNVEVVQFAIRENANTTAVKADLQVLLYSTSAPTTPVAGSTYNGSTTNLLGSVQVSGADYQRIADTIWDATVQPRSYITSASTSSNVTAIYAVVLANNSETFAASDTHSLRIWTKQNEQVSTS